MSPSSAIRQNSLESAASLLKLALADRQISCDNRRLAADLRQAATQGDANVSSEWTDWFLTASPASGLKCRQLTGQPEELSELALAGVIVLIPFNGEWLTIGERGSVRSIDADGRLRSDRSLAQCLSGSTAALEAVVIEGGFPQSVADHHGATPWQRLIRLLSPEWRDILTILIYSLVIALLTLATPIAVESLVNTVAFGRLVQPIVVLSTILFGFLAFSAALRALQTFVAEIVQRRLFARVASDLAWRLPRVDATAIEGRNMPELVNRFFDIVTVQKVVSAFLLDGIGIVLTTLVGMSVLAFYHPLLLAFDLVLLIAVAFILFVLGYGGVGTSIKESKYKYATADTLEEIARCVHLFKGHGGAELALQHMDRQVAGYLDARKKHFRVLLRQTFSSLMLQALASTVLLGLGGWLVINGQLTLGQLVAAELIVTVIVSSVAKFGKHLESFYDVMASIDKLGYLFDLPVEPCVGAVSIPGDRPFELNISEVSIGSGTGFVAILGQSVAVTGEPLDCARLMDQLYGLRAAESGSIQLSGVDIRDIRSDLLRRDVALVRDVEILEGTISDNISLGRADVSHEQMWDAIRLVRLEQRINSLPLGIRCQLAVNGSPLSRTEVTRLIFARALAAHPRLLLVDGELDSLSDEEVEGLIASGLMADPSRVLILVSGRQKLREACGRQIRLGCD